MNKMVLVPFGKIAMHYFLVTSASLIATLAWTSCCFGSDFVFIRSNRSVSPEQEEMQVAAGFYGLNLRVVTATSGADSHSIRTAVEQNETVGVVIDADALTVVSENQLLRALNRRADRSIPLLILGVTTDTNPTVLKAWSSGDATRCTRRDNSANSRYTFSQVEGVTWQLADLDVPFFVKSGSYLAFEDSGTAQRIESVRDGRKTFPIFIERAMGHQVVFLACATSEEGSVADSLGLVSGFLRIAPAMIFARYSAGERGWHTLHYYANFTIDDPWLREPYGYVEYEGLLREMEKHHFHTTIAFIPWNYERSQPDVVSLFRNHPDLFSIAIHGNDHDHKEFTDYEAKSLTDQVGDLRQALARMEQFQRLTGIPYDKVMIFPHSIAPEQTLGVLKTYNYLATVNSSNIPQNAIRTADLSPGLRPVTLSYEGFPSISRYSTRVQVPEAYLAINEFLGNPLFLYDHSDLFSKGIGAFDQVADDINKREPATEWRSLGEIVRHLYVVRLRDDSNYDVLAFSNNFCLENTTSRNSSFYVQKQEVGGQAIGSVSVDGRGHPYALEEDQISLVVAIPSGSTRCVTIQYANNLQSGSVDASHDSVVVYMLRMGSDFRDIYLAKSGIGLRTIRFYNEHQLKPAEVVGCLLLFFVAWIWAGWRLSVFVRRRLLLKPGPTPLPQDLNH